MDLLLGGFFKENQNSLSEVELLEFEKILEFTDKLLSDWLIFEKPNNDLTNFLISKKIKDFKIKP
jgi:succinate dehydrogenase flavin-adding protein (antitoxin of CptAB toxin-antitoxin module)